MPTPEEIQAAHDVALRLGRTAKTATIVDNGYAARCDALIRDTVQVVQSGGSAPRRLKRSAGAWVDAHGGGGMTRQGRDFYVFAVGVGAVVCLAGACAFAAVGWWALLPGIPIGVGVFFANKYASRKWTKHKVIEAVTNLHTDPFRRATDEDGLLAEYMLTVLISEHARLRDKKGKYFDASTRAADWRRVKATAVNGAADASVGRNVSGRWNTWGGLRGSGDAAAAKEKATILMRRELLMLQFLKEYLELLQTTLTREVTEHLRTVDTAITRAAAEVVKLGRHHRHCADDCCYGPGDADLTLTPLAVPALRAAPQIRDARAAAVPAAGMIEATGDVRQMIDRLRAAGVGGAGSHQQSRLRAALENASDYGAVDAVQGTLLGAGGEALESALPEALAESAAGMAPDLAVGPIGFVLGLIIGQAIEAATVNAPADRAAAQIRAAMPAQLDDELAKAAKKASPDVLERALNRVHNHHLKRAHERLQKLQADPVVVALNTNNQSVLKQMTCGDAVRLVRYLFKVYQNVAKAQSNIAFVRAAVRALENDLNATFPS